MEYVLMTKEIFEAGTSRNGAWSIKQLNLIGVDITPGKSPLKGWKYNVIGRSYPEDIINEFLALKDKHLKPLTVGNQFGNDLFTQYDKMNLDFEL
jgi:hypothetical protein